MRFTIEEIQAPPMVACPFKKLLCCVLNDGGGALVITGAKPARDLQSRSRR